MSWFKTLRANRLRAGAAGIVLLAGGCGFRPLYLPLDDRPDIRAQLRGIEIATPATGAGDILKQQLVRRFGAGGAKSARLVIALTLDERDVLIRRDAKVTRRSFILSARYHLETPGGADGAAAVRQDWTGRSRAAASYDRIASEFANVTARQNARARAMRILAEDIGARVAGFLHRQAAQAQTGDRP